MIVSLARLLFQVSPLILGDLWIINFNIHWLYWRPRALGIGWLRAAGKYIMRHHTAEKTHTQWSHLWISQKAKNKISPNSTVLKRKKL